MGDREFKTESGVYGPSGSQTDGDGAGECDEM